MSQTTKAFVVSVPVSATVTVHAATAKEAAQMARELIDELSPSSFFVDGWNQGKQFAEGVYIASAGIVSVSEELCDIEDEEWNEYDETD